MPSSTYHITEPHPSVASNSTYVYAGRGGAGNYAHVDPKTLTAGATASGPASRTTLTKSSAAAASSSASGQKPYYASGRGGAGNFATSSPGSERPMFSFDEELERQRRMLQHQAPVYHVGRGGAGNFASEKQRRSESMSSSDSIGSEKARKSIEGMIGRIRGSFGSATSK